MRNIALEILCLKPVAQIGQSYVQLNRGNCEEEGETEAPPEASMIQKRSAGGVEVPGAVVNPHLLCVACKPSVRMRPRPRRRVPRGRRRGRVCPAREYEHALRDTGTQSAQAQKVNVFLSYATSVRTQLTASEAHRILAHGLAY